MAFWFYFIKGCWLFHIFINSWYFSAYTTTSSINMINFYINICDQKNLKTLKSYIFILNIDNILHKKPKKKTI